MKFPGEVIRRIETLEATTTSQETKELLEICRLVHQSAASAVAAAIRNVNALEKAGLLDAVVEGFEVDGDILVG